MKCFKILLFYFQGKGKKNGNDDSNKLTNAGGKNDTVTEADVKIEPSKDGRRTPLHARDMEPVSC